jgi:hypothetical protein
MSFAAAKKDLLKMPSTPVVVDPAPSVLPTVTPPEVLPVFPPLPGVIDPVEVNVNKEEDEDEDEDEQDDAVSSPFKIADEMQRVSTGPSKVIANEIKLLVDVDECGEILKLLSLHHKYLKGEICACGVRLTPKYKELGTCASCSGYKNPVEKILCKNCKLISLKGKWVEIGLCSSCLGGIKKRDDMGGAACGKKKK